MATRIIRLPEVESLTGLKRSAYERIAEGTFARPVPLSEGEHGPVGWIEEEVHQWIADRIAARERGEKRRSPHRPELAPGAEPASARKRPGRSGGLRLGCSKPRKAELTTEAR